MPISELKAQIARLPEQPGVYLYLNRDGDTIYVGKARVLRERVRSYLSAYGSSPKTDALLDDAHAVEVIVTDSVVEALALENHLIKQRAPRYNVLLRDDKNYPYLQLTTNEAFPRVLVARRVERDGSFYAGPFLPASFARKTMSLTHRLFGIRSCNEVITGRRDRACLEYDIGRCVAPCVASLCGPETYARVVADTRLFLEGRNDELVGQLRGRMVDAADAEQFERAAQIRDAIRTIEALRAREQKMATVQLGDRDAFGVKVGPAGAVIQVFQMRGGRVVERVELVTEASGPVGESETEVLQAGLQQFYETRSAPPEVHVPVVIEDAGPVGEWLSARAGRKVRLVVPRRGEKRGLLDLATRNATVSYRQHFEVEAVRHREMLETLRVALALPVVPRRIECFDISTIQGRETVASLVVCEDGRMRPAQYRKFRIRRASRDTPSGRRPRSKVSTPDDFAAMREVVFRRFRRLLDQGGPFPDLVLVDGGQGQVSAAYDAFKDLGLSHLVAVGLAKKEERVFRRDRPDPLVLEAGSPALLLLQRIRDEAHRVAVTFHRRARALRDFQSELDDVPGIGPRRRQRLLTTFGSLAGVRRATREELVRVIGTRAADAVLIHLASAG